MEVAGSFTSPGTFRVVGITVDGPGFPERGCGPHWPGRRVRFLGLAVGLLPVQQPPWCEVAFPGLPGRHGDLSGQPWLETRGGGGHLQAARVALWQNLSKTASSGVGWSNPQPAGPGRPRTAPNVARHKLTPFSKPWEVFFAPFSVLVRFLRSSAIVRVSVFHVRPRRCFLFQGGPGKLQDWTPLF